MIRQHETYEEPAGNTESPCTCKKKPQAALDEKDFIRMKLREGHSVEHVIQLLEKEHAHKTT
jgi:hypothetical protein